MNRAAFMLLLASLSLAACKRGSSDRVQGYVEGEFVYVASPYAGMLEKRPAERGSQVAVGTPLFSLECAAEIAARDQAVRRVEQAEAQLADSQKGMRTTEMDSLEAQLERARSSLVLSQKEFDRQTGLLARHVSSVQEMDKARATRDQDQQQVTRLEADLKTAQLGSRSDQVSAAEANVHALKAALVRAEWDLAQKRQIAPVAGLVFDTLFEVGEWVPAGRPVISLLPPGNIKVRAFVPEGRVGSIQVGAPVRVRVDGAGESPGKVSFISPRAEFTPPVIYSQESRGKLVFMVEIAFPPEVAAKLHPGQPVDVTF